MDEVPLRTYIEAVLEEQRRALDVASTEREKSAQALAAEREKAAQALALSLARSIEQGDENLRIHMQQQVEQLKAMVESTRREMQIMHDASERAIAKAESATEKRFEGVNEFRAQLADQSSTFLSKEVAEATFKELRSGQESVRSRLDTAEGRLSGIRDNSQGLATRIGLMLTGMGVVIGFVVLVANHTFG